MGHRLKIWATMTSIILLSGMLGFGFSPDAFALSSQGEANGQAKGCQNGTAKNNPHCNGDGSFTDCDTDMSGDIDAVELQVSIGGTVAEAQTLIDDVEDLAILASLDTNDNGDIDTSDELDLLNSLLPPEDRCL